MPNVYRSLAFSFLEKFALIGVTLVSYVLIARLLTPEEIGIYSVSAALIAIGQVVREFGIGNFLIQEKNLTRDHIRTAFGVSLLMSFILFLIVSAAAPLVVDFYKDERMTSIVRIIALNFLVMPFCSISLALLRREMQFGKLTSVNVVAAIVGMVTTLGLAFAKFGPQSLAWGIIATNCVTGFGAWVARSDNKIISPSLCEWRKVLTFGSQSAGAGVVTSAAMGMNDLTIGRILGFAPAAIFSRANGLVAMFNQQVMDAIRSVALPAFARAHRQNQSMEPLYIASVTAVTAVAWPFYGFVALNATGILRIMFGPQWDESAAYVPIFCISAAISSTYNLVLTLAISIGRNDVAFRTDLIMQPIRALITVITLIFLKSLEAAAWAMLIFNIIGAIYLLYVKNSLIPTNTKSILQGLFSSFNLMLICMIIPIIYKIFPNSSDVNQYIDIFTQAILVTTVWTVSIFWLAHPLSTDQTVRKLRNRVVAAIPQLGWIFPIDK